ncbi:m7GpppN-mRNA hydrolase-like protein [Leptotrombidium deliense]|uniref:m7GpppN-mRNA hydrolase n=1 Tax=Leptotrombidium deliense TaxID=299467 RepID=A0A443S3C7_9ACAR|nr:m7GpppN-mRNA hydrolase-like protein [Leptotrombidium deliense]
MSEMVNSTIPIDILDDISSRFIINIPADERDDVIRLMFQIELGHWFYIDFHCALRNDLPKLNLRAFCVTLFNHVPFLKKHAKDLDKVMDKWKSYKLNVPTYGAIILDESLEYVLMVQGFWAKSSWGFPKGKVNKEEDPVVCAVREVREETGFDCSSLVDENEYIELKIRDTLQRLYIVHGVNKDTNFQPQTRHEIRSIEWFAIKDLPSHKGERNANQFFMTMPFLKHLRRWVSNYKETRASKRFFDNRDIKIVSPKCSGKPGIEQQYPNITICRRNDKQNLSTVAKHKQNGAVHDHSYSKYNNSGTKFWAKSWENVRFDWRKIWKEVMSET